VKKQSAGSLTGVRSLAGAAEEPFLLLGETTKYQSIYSDKGSGAKEDVTIWRPIPSDPSYFILGDYAQDNHQAAAGAARVVRAVNENPANPLIKPPIGYVEVWNDHGTGTRQDCSIWYPRPPDGYVSIGYVANNRYEEPDLRNYACLRHDLVGQIDPGTPIWMDKGSGARMNVALYEVVDAPYTFIAKGNYEPNTISTNDFELKMAGLSDFSFDVSEHSITHRQPWDGVTCDSDKTGATITVRAGRKASKAVADWFKQKIGKRSQAIGCHTIDRLPKELNFAFTGTMAFTHRRKRYVGMEVVIGQGSTGFGTWRNNWWIGGPLMLTKVAVGWGILAAAFQPFVVTSLPPAAGVVLVVTPFAVSSMKMVIISKLPKPKKP